MDNLLAKNSFKQTKSFNCLPTETILKICLYLDRKSLKSLSLSCTRCANVVGNSTVILRNFKLKLTGDFWQSKYKQLQLFSLYRQHSTIEVADTCEKDCPMLLTIFQKFGPQLRTLKILKSQIDDFTLRGILKSSSVLQELFLSEVMIIQKLPVINPISMVQLKSLNVQHCNWMIFRLLLKSQINSLEINSYFNEGYRHFLVDFLAQQYQLKELTLHGTSSRVLFQLNDVNENSKFNLTNFHIGRSLGRNSDAVNCNIIDFLKLNKTLKNVEISVPNCEHISAFVLMNLNSVTSIIFDVSGLPKDRSFYETLAKAEPNVHLKTLKIRGFFFQLDFIKAVLMKFPAVKSLELNDWSNTTSVSDMLKFVSINFQHLQRLYITEISNGYEDIRFDGLKQLSVTYIRNKHNLINFIMINRSVQALKVGFVYIEQITSHFIDDLFNLEHVHHLSLAGNDKALKMIGDIIQTNASNSLKTLELSLISYEKSPTFASRSTIKLNFPIDPYDFGLKFNVLF